MIVTGSSGGIGGAIGAALRNAPMVDEIMDRYIAMDLYPDREAAAKRMPKSLGRMTAPDDIARAVRFPASDDAAHITGSEMVVDGGVLAR